MWFNSTVSVEPYQGLDVQGILWKQGSALLGILYSGAAWLSSVCTVKRSLNWGNIRNPYPKLLCLRKLLRYIGEEGGDDVKSAWPLMSWATHVLQWLVQRDA